MVLTLLPAGVFATDATAANDVGPDPTPEPAPTYVAQVGETGYTTLAEAVNAADNATITLLTDVTEDVTIPEGKTVTLDLNGKKLVNSATAQNDKVEDKERKHTITNNGTLTIVDSVGTGVVDNVSHGRAALYNAGTIVEIKGGKFTRSVDNSTDATSAKGNSWYVVKNAENATINKISGGEFLAVGKFSSLFCNSGTIDEISGGTFTQNGFIAFKNEGTVNKISGGTFSSEKESCIQNWGTIGEITGGTITAGSIGIWNFSSDTYSSVGKVGNISGGNISGTTAAIRLYDYDTVYKDYDENVSKPSETNKASISISAGNFSGALEVGENTIFTITGGYFTSDPSAYVATGYVAGTSDVTGYSYKVVAKTDTGSVEVKPAVAAPEVKVSDSISKEDQDTVKAAAKTVSAPTLGAAAGDIVKDINEDTAKALIEKATEVDQNTAKLYVQSALKVEPTAYDKESKTLTLEITPQYRVVASAATKADEIKLDGNNKNAQAVQDYQTMNITKETVVTMALPTGFVADGVDKLSIKHTKDNGTVEYYTGIVTETSGTKTLTFTTNGFSPFVISAPAASIGENVYPTLQAAVDAAKNGETIKILKDNETAVVNRTVKFTVNPDGMKYTITLGANCTDKDKTDNVFDVVYTAPVYAPITKKDVKFDDVDVNAYYAPAVKWAVENKITAGKTDKLFAPDDTCTRGEMITFLWNAAGKPAAKNTTNPFTDVNAGAFYYDAVLWAVSNGITSGTTDTTFSPDDTVNRAQVVAFLYNYANKPAAANSTFSDVAADAYYAPAVGWAAAQKITSGTGNNTFSPENDCTRAQIVTFLYNDLAK